MTLLKDGDTRLNTISQKGKNGTPLFWGELNFERYEGAMIFRVLILIFCSESTVRDSVMATFSRKSHSESTKFTQRLQGTLTTGFERHLLVEDFMDMDQDWC